MNTPICDFINAYADSQSLRLHMPGHKGKAQLGFEKYDITEFAGADSLYHPNGIIKESENNASELFGSGKTLYSTEGSSHCIRAMLCLAKMYSGSDCGFVLAGRNAHSSFISACALNDLDVRWIYPRENESYLSCTITPQDLEKALTCVNKAPACVYITSPDYLGSMCDIKGLAKVCENHNTLLLVDNAHGAYLRFLKEDMHPISLGAHLCCDSAHKTLPVLTGGAYMHISKKAPEFFKSNAREALSLFGSTSPSYLILASLDNANKYISQGYRDNLSSFILELDKLKKSSFLYKACACPGEPLKLTLKTKKFGYRGEYFAKMLHENNIVCEFFDDDFVVLMPSLENGIEEIHALFAFLDSVEAKAPINEDVASLVPPKKKMSIRDAIYSPKETIPVDLALGRILSASNVSCPPAVSIVVCGEELNESAIKLCKKYGFHTVSVVK